LGYGGQVAARLILEQANVAAVSRQVELAVFYEAKLALSPANAPRAGAACTHQLRPFALHDLVRRQLLHQLRRLALDRLSGATPAYLPFVNYARR
jgi:hypothetical protein